MIDIKRFEVIHIHTDLKFLSDSKRFEGSYFSNKTLIINQENDTPKTAEDVLLYSTAESDIQEIIELCSDVDLVVLYGLNSIKVKIALALPKKVKIAWRFFGYELYHKRRDLVLSELSKKYAVLPLKKRLKTFLSICYQRYIKRRVYINDVELAIKRINYFLVLSQEEYQFLSQHFDNLPLFIQLPHFYSDRNKTKLDFRKKETQNPLIIIGNNRSPYNNHLDIIELIERCKNKKRYSFILFFNYGGLGKYTQEVLKRIENKNHYAVISKFLDQTEFLSTYEKATALVINGYRQMAGANIRTALENGVKVYLSDKNVHKKFLEKQGFKIFSIEDFKNDLDNNSLTFDKTTAVQNAKNIKFFYDSYTPVDFQQQLFKRMKE